MRLNRGWNTTKSANEWVAAPVPPPVPQTWSGNAQSFQYNLPFSFPFFGASYSSVWVSTSGYLTVGSATGSTGTTVDLANANFRAIAPYARDLTVATLQADSISVQTPANNSFVRFRWKARVTGTTQIANFEAILSNDGTITFNYQNLPASGTARVGVTPGNGIDFVAVPGFDRAFVPSSAQKVTLAPASESVQASYTYNALDQLTGGTGLSGISYSTDGEQKTITGPSPRGAWTFGYDGRELMTSAVSGGNTTSWTLDGEARVVKEVKGGVETRNRFAGPGDAPAWEENASGAVTTSFITGPTGLLASYVAGTPTFYLMSGHGDVAQTRNLSGGLIESYAYDENGQPISTQAPTRYGYAGQWQKTRHPDVSFIRMGSRMLDPMLGRFTSWDPIEGGSLNAYDYAAGDPLNMYDLDGRRAVADDGPTWRWGSWWWCKSGPCTVALREDQRLYYEAYKRRLKAILKRYSWWDARHWTTRTWQRIVRTTVCAAALAASVATANVPGAIGSANGCILGWSLEIVGNRSKR